MSNFVPFWLTPKSWFLSGKNRDEAEAIYELSGLNLDRRLAEINFEGIDLKRELIAVDFKHHLYDEYTRDMMLLALDGKDNDPIELLNLYHTHKRMSSYDYHVGMAKETLEGQDLAVRLLEIEFENGKLTEKEYREAVLEETIGDETERAIKLVGVQLELKEISQQEHDKEVATLKEEPWIQIVDSGFDQSRGIGGVFFEFDWNEFWITYLRLHGYVGASDAEVVDMWFSDVCSSQGLAVTNH